jgi:TP901-1 family phage major tail protein
MNFKKFFRRSFRYLRLACALTMFIVFAAVTLPDNPSTSSATVGKDYLLYVNTGTVAAPVWTLIGGQRGSSLGRTADSIDTSHKTSGGWKSSKAGLRGWSIDLDGLVLLGDLGIEALETAFTEGKEVNIKFEYPDKKYRTGWASITDFSFETPHDGEASLSGSLEGNGELSTLQDATAITNTVLPTEAVFSKAAPEDLTFTVTSNGTVDLVSLKIGSTVVNPSNYGYDANVLTIEGDYLGGLANGVKVFTLVMSAGDNLTVAVTVGA